MDRLGSSSSLPPQVILPRYQPENHGVGIVHFGLGAFHRGHMAVYTDDVMAAHGGDWRIVGISLRSPAVRDRLAPQNCRYTLVERGQAGEKLRIVGSVKEVLVAPEDPESVLRRLTDPGVKIVSFTITEKGYLCDPASGELQADHPDIQHDLNNPNVPCTMHGFITESLARRRHAGLPPLTLLCCDNLPANGQALRQAVCGFARLREPALADWIEANISFPCTMVDRIVPATTREDVEQTASTLGCRDEAPVICEPFCQWVIENAFSSPRPAWHEFGATMVEDVAPYEEMKLRLLNSTHSAMAYLGYLGGIATIDQVITTPEYATFVERLMAEVVPTLHMPADVDLSQYCRVLIDRFRNPSLRHHTWQIAMDGSQKIPRRLLSSIRLLIAADKPYPHLAMSVAGWLRYIYGIDEQGQPFEVNDPYAGRLRAVAEKNAGDISGYVQEILRVQEIFGDDLATNSSFRQTIENALTAICNLGARGAIKRVS
jgi:fructuronate reductase